LPTEKFKNERQFSHICKIRAFCPTGKSFNSLFYPTPSSQITFVAYFGYSLIDKVFLHHLVSKISKKYKKIGFGGFYTIWYQRFPKNIKKIGFGG